MCTIEMKREEEVARGVLLALGLEDGDHGGSTLTLCLVWALVLGRGMSPPF